MINIPRRNLLIPAMALGAASLLPKRADADVAFSSFAFPATGAPTPRTMPDRLAEIKNVLDFGADPTGGTDSTSAIQAAVNWTSGANRGTIYFPLGAYKVTAPITYNYNGNLSIHFLGAMGANIFGNVNGYIFDRALGTPNNTPGGRVFEKLNIINSHAAGGCIRMGSTIGGAVRDCLLQGFIDFTTEDAVGVSSKNIHIENCAFSNNGTVSGSHYIIIGGGGSILGCTLSGADTAVRAYGDGLYGAGNRSERCNTSWLFGLDSGGNNVGLRGLTLTSSSAEGCWTAYDFAGVVEGFVMAGCGHFGHDSSNAGVVPGVQASQYGIRIRADCARAGLIHSISLSGVADVASFAIENASSRANVVIRECSAIQSGGSGVNWITPTNAYTAKFRNNNVSPVWTYAQRPIGGDALEGDEFDITDSNTATWGATVAGGGSNRIRMRYNGTNWTVMGN
jgi:Pectate lyase superfamily protein